MIVAPVRPGFHPNAQFPFVAGLEASFGAIREELEVVRGLEDGFIPWPETGLYGAGWDVFGFYAFGQRLDANCEYCPRTVAAVEVVPGLTTAGFSRLAPGARIRPHTGYTNRVLRCHLGLVTPPDCALRVGSEVRSWVEGRCLVFDDTLEHEAWNRSPTERIVLLLDFLH